MGQFLIQIIRDNIYDLFYSPIAKYAMVDGKKSLNCATYNFLNFIGNGQIEVNLSFYI